MYMKNATQLVWVSDYRLMPNEFFSAISLREQIIFWCDDYFPFVQDQHAELDFYSANSLKQQSVGIHVTPLGHIILIQSHLIFSLIP